MLIALISFLKYSIYSPPLSSHPRSLPLTLLAIPLSSLPQDFRKNVSGATDVTHSYIGKLVQQMEKGFDSLHPEFMSGGCGLD